MTAPAGSPSGTGAGAPGRWPSPAAAPFTTGALEEPCGVVTRYSRGASSGRLAFQVGGVLARGREAVQLRSLREFLLAGAETGRLTAPGLECRVLQGAAVAEREVPGQFFL